MPLHQDPKAAKAMVSLLVVAHVFLEASKPFHLRGVILSKPSESHEKLGKLQVPCTVGITPEECLSTT